MKDCLFCRYSNGKKVFAFDRTAPQANTESLFSASVIGCTYYIVLAIIWSMIWWGCGRLSCASCLSSAAFLEPRLLPFCGLSHPGTTQTGSLVAMVVLNAWHLAYCRYIGLDPIKWMMMYILNEVCHGSVTVCCLPDQRLCCLPPVVCFQIFFH